MSLIAWTNHNKRSRLKNLTKKHIAGCEMQLPWVEDQCKPCILHLLRYFQFICFVVNISDYLPWFNVFHTQRFAILFSDKISRIHIYHIANFVAQMWLTVLIGPVSLFLLCSCYLILQEYGHFFDLPQSYLRSAIQPSNSHFSKLKATQYQCKDESHCLQKIVLFL